MKTNFHSLAWVLLTAGLSLCDARADRLRIQIPLVKPAQNTGFKMGAHTAPGGATLTLDSNSLRLNGKAWMPVMGEFHYSRCPANEWREELLKMKAGGVDIVATYVFWIHHEEIEGQFDWSERRNLRRFVQTCADVGLKALVRCGPWCHGEVRNGGQPDWLLKKGWKLRTDDPNYLEQTRILYQEIGKQLEGLFWKDGGPVTGIQFENEYWGPPEHLLNLKRIGREAGLDVPLYTRTGWPELKSPLPFGEIVPLYGVYAEGFWDRETTPMPGRYWSGFHFSTLRTDVNIANEILGRRDARDDEDVNLYPYLTCEIGGGMMNSYHRRIWIDPEDITSTTLVKLGSGSTSPGYYMYQGGVNPEGKLTTLQESQATEYWNDLPVKSYDFQAPLGEYGQLRPQYHGLRRMHLFLRDWGPLLAGMPAAMPEQRSSGKNDVSTLRWCARSDGRSGFVFVNNYERLKTLPPKKDVQFEVLLPDTKLTFPSRPCTVPAGSHFFVPFNLDLAKDAKLLWATAQPVCQIEEGRTTTVFFAEIPGMSPEFAFSKGTYVSVARGKLKQADQAQVFHGLKPSRRPAVELEAEGGSSVRLVLLSDGDSKALWKADWNGRPRVLLTAAGLVVDKNQIRLTSSKAEDLNVGIYPAPTAMSGKVTRRSDGVFERFTPAKPKWGGKKPGMELVRCAGPLRTIPLGKIKQPVAAAPEDPDFEHAAVWQINLPEETNLGTDPLLRIHYVGDVARVMLNGKLVTDDFYNGKPFDIGLKRHAPSILEGELQVAILPLQKHARIYLADRAIAPLGKEESLAEIRKLEIIPRLTVTLESR